MDRYWLLTSTTYATWLPGEREGFVSNVPTEDGNQVIHNIPGTPIDADMPRVKQRAQKRMLAPPVYLIQPQADALIAQFQETAKYRGWELCAAAVMRNHFHIVVGVVGDPDPDDLLRDFKSYGSRALNRRWGKPSSETWWTESGSKRKIKDQIVLRDKVIYVRDQAYPLAIWLSDFWWNQIGERGALAPR